MTVKEHLLYTTKTDDRSRMRAVANNLILHIHPTKVAKPALRFSYTWGLGGISTLLAMILAITGVLLMFRYDASIDRAYTSIQAMETEVLFGSLIRALHHWSANLLIITAFLHMLRVFFSGGFKQGRSANWMVGIALLLLVIAFNFTGYLLPWDQLAYWAITVGTSLLDYVPVMGSAVSGFLLAGPEVGQGALRNFYAIHVAVLPALLVILMSYHFWKVRKDGGISQPIVPTCRRRWQATARRTSDHHPPPGTNRIGGGGHCRDRSAAAGHVHPRPARRVGQSQPSPQPGQGSLVLYGAARVAAAHAPVWRPCCCPASC